jgi:hypothetical protein
VIIEYTDHARDEMGIHSVTEDDVVTAIRLGRPCPTQPRRHCRRYSFARSSVTVICEGDPRTEVLVVTVWRARR